ncbi:MAG: ABC transporter permease [Proteobacteria bacterium]|jgi:putative ABC transport system permease protein|nr:ABC transporter permease [Pseudomonadota bacterium]
MMRIFSLALRNLFRNIRRTILTVSAISVGLAMMLWVVNFQNGSYTAMIKTAVSTMAGHVVIQDKEYQEEKETKLVVDDVSGIKAMLHEEFPDAVIAPRIFLGGLLVSSSNSVGAAITGFEPEAEAKVQDLAEKIDAGKWLDDDIKGILIGIDMAESLEVGIGDKLVYMGQNYAGENDDDDVQSRLFRVKGIFKTGTAQFDGFLAFTHLKATQELLGGRDVANMVTIHFPNPNDAEAAVPTIASKLAQPDAVVLHWRDALAEIYGMIEIDRSSGDVMLSIIGLIVAFGVLNTMLMSVLERTREFGVMLSLGMKPRKIAQLVLMEGVLLGFIGAMGGLVLGLLISWHAVTYGIDFSSMMGGAETMESGGIAIDTLMVGKWDPRRMSFYFIGAILFCGMASIYPAWSISRLQPVQALRHH